MCDIIHDSPAFNRMPLGVNEVIVDLIEMPRETTDEKKSCIRCMYRVDRRHYRHIVDMLSTEDYLKELSLPPSNPNCAMDLYFFGCIIFTVLVIFGE